MSQQVLPIIGGVVGAFFGYPQLGFVVGGLIASATAPAAQGPQLGDLPVQSFDEGTPRAIIYGTSQTTGYVIAAGPAIKTTEVTDAGGKGGGSVEGEVAYRNYAIAMCEGPIAAVLRVWADDKLVYDVRPGSLMLAESAEWIKNKVFYMGTEDQLPDVFLQLNVSGIDTPAYRGTAYMVVGLEDLTDRRGTIPMYRFEVTNSVTSEPLPPISGSSEGDMNARGSPWPPNYELPVSSTRTKNVTRVQVELENALGIPGWQSEMETTCTITVGSSVYTKSFVGTSSFYVQVNGGGRPISVIAKAKNISGANVTTGFNLYVRWNFADTDASVSPYPGGDEIFVEPDASNYGVAYRSGSLVSLPWGPGFLESAGGPVALSEIVTDICERAGLEEDAIDVDDLNDQVDGLTLAGDYTAASAIDTLRPCYFFDKCEPGEKLYFPKRGKPVALTLDIDDLVEIPDMSRREQATEVPRKLHLHYANATAGYAPIKSTYMRSSTDVQSTLESTVQVPVNLNTDQAAQMVEKMFKVTVADAQGEIKISVPDSFIRLVPSDCIGLNLRDQVRRLRIDEIEMADGVMHLTCRADRQSAYTSVLTGIPVDPPVLPPSTLPGDTVWAVMDLPARIDSEDDLNYLVAGTGASEGWTGWAYQRSTDGGANYSTVTRLNRAAVMGFLVDPVASASQHYTDTTSVVRVQLIRQGQVLEDLTEFQFLTEGGAFALQTASGWEILQYLDAEDEGDGVFALRTLHRGLLNTTPASHSQNDLFVSLERASHIPAQASWIGMTLSHRGVSIGRSPETATEVIEEFEGNSQREWPVAQVQATEAAGIVSVSWIPRHRFGSDLVPVASINFQGYRVTVDDGTNSITQDVTTSSATIDASALTLPVTVSVAPINRITGLGPAVSTTV